MIITFPDTKETIDAIRAAIGREVTFFTTTLSGCYNCSLNPVTNTSTNSFCPVCSGLYWIPTLSGTEIMAHVTWGKADILNWQSAGQLFDGDCRVQIEYTPNNVTIVEDVEYVEIDTKQFEVKKTIFRGVPELNRILLDLIERKK